MTGSDDSNSSTRPISVAELLAKNGTIGAPPVGGRRRRRRGNADAVTVAELTGEIPIIRPDDPPAPPVTVAPLPEPVVEPEPEAEPEDVPEDLVEEPETAEPEADEAAVEDVTVEPDEAADNEIADDEIADDEVADDEDADDEVADDEAAATDDIATKDAAAKDSDDEYADAVAEYTARVEQRGSEPEPAEPAEAQPTRRFGLGRLGRKSPAVDAESWTPDPVDESAATDEVDDVVEPVEIEELDDETALDTDTDTDTEGDGGDRDELPSYLRSTEEPLFGGQTVADDLARRGGRPSPAEADLDDEDVDDDAEYGEPRTMSPVVHGLWIVGQSVVAVVFGAGLFVAFDQLWKWNNIVALVLSVLVILGLVVGVRVVRKTEDIGSTLIAVAVGALVTLGPLALLQSG